MGDLGLCLNIDKEKYMVRIRQPVASEKQTNVMKQCQPMPPWYYISKAFKEMQTPFMEDSFITALENMEQEEEEANLQDEE